MATVAAPAPRDRRQRPQPRLLYTSGELRELRKLQAIALNERSRP